MLAKLLLLVACFAAVVAAYVACNHMRDGDQRQQASNKDLEGFAEANRPDEKPVQCAAAELERAVTDAFMSQLNRAPSSDELASYVERLKPIEVRPSKCYDTASALMGGYMQRSFSAASTTTSSATASAEAAKASTSSTSSTSTTPTTSTTSTNATNTTAQASSPTPTSSSRGMTAASAASLYQQVFGHQPSPAMQELLELKLRAEPDMPADRMRDFLVSLREADQSAGAILKAPATTDPLYAGLQETQAPDTRAINADVLNGVVCAGVMDKSDPHKETLLADLMNGRNKLQLMNLCKRAKDDREPEATREGQGDAESCAGGGADCGDGNAWIRESRLQGTPLSQAQSFTSVGSIMPRFVYAEYV